MAPKSHFRLSDYLPEKTIKLDSPNEVGDFVAALNESRTVENVDMSQISIGKEVAVVLGRALSRHPELKDLRMVAAFKARDIDEVKQCLEALADGISRSGCRLRSLDLSENAFRGTGIRSFAAVMTGPCCFELEVLNMSDQGLSPEGGTELSKMLEELRQNAAAENTSVPLRIFKASKNRLENGGATALGRVFERIPSLEQVEIFQCSISSKGVADLLRGLTFSHGMRRLDIVDNTTKDQAEEALVKALKNWSRLEELHISSCLISTEGMVEVLKTIRQLCHQIKLIDMSENEVEGEAEQILDSLLHMNRLESVVLRDNDFYDSKQIKNLFQRAFADIGKPKAIKKTSGVVRSYGLADDDEDESDTSEDEVEVAFPTDRQRRSPAPSGDSVSEPPGDAPEDEMAYLLVQEDVKDPWSLTVPEHLRAVSDDPTSDDDPIIRRMEMNHPFTTLLPEVGLWQSYLPDSKQHRELLQRMCQYTSEMFAQRYSGYEEAMVEADHKLDAILQYSEYVVSTSVSSHGPFVLLEEMLRCCGLAFGQPFPEKQLESLLWILLQMLHAQVIPLFALKKMDGVFRSSGGRVEELKKVGCFSQVIDLLQTDLAV